MREFCKHQQSDCLDSALPSGLRTGGRARLKRRPARADLSAVKRLRLAYADRVGAGASAEQRYKQLASAWWARVRWRVLLCILVVPALALIFALLWPRHRELFAGFGLGGAAILYAALRALAAPAHVERWLDGAEAEKRTAKQLRPLLRKAGWSAVHDRASRYGNRDHIVVGPSGVYLLDTKAPGGIVTVEDGAMTVRRHEDPDDLYTQRSLVGQIKGAAAELAEDLARTTGRKAWVTPVVVIWAPFEQRSIEQHGVRWVHGEALHDWLAGEPPKMAEARREQLARAVEAMPRQRQDKQPDPNP